MLLGVPVIGGTAGVTLSLLDGSTSFLQMPVFGIFVYLWLVTLFNRTEIEVATSGGWVRSGPLPSGYERERRIERSAVNRLLTQRRARALRLHRGGGRRMD
jgi:hypothetical protein